MPRYYFNIDDGQSVPDAQGTVMEDLAQAKCEAVRMAGHIICDAAGEFWDRSAWTMTVTDDRGLTMFTLNFVGTESPGAHRQAKPPPRGSRASF